MNKKLTFLVILSILILINLNFGQRPPFKAPFNPDSLQIAHKNILQNTGYETQKLKWNLKNTIGTSLILSCGILAYFLDDKADENYSRYLKTGDLQKMDKFYKNTKKYDRYKGLSYIGI
ncbi:MAG: hypothetical protein K9M80_05770, partial [Candidatus Marinimicrobia bacterium]|nr:hypothetical protein [Candidatus Neomarinimicrobiota bacterium]